MSINLVFVLQSSVVCCPYYKNENKIDNVAENSRHK